MAAEPDTDLLGENNGPFELHGVSIPGEVLNDPVFAELQSRMDTIQPGGEFKFDVPVTLSDNVYRQAKAAKARRVPDGGLTWHLVPVKNKVTFNGENRVLVWDDDKKVFVEKPDAPVYQSRFMIDGMPFTFAGPKELLLLQNVVNTEVTTDERSTGPTPDDVERFNTAVALVMRQVG